jgi:hypothetical protein
MSLVYKNNFIHNKMVITMKIINGELHITLLRQGENSCAGIGANCRPEFPMLKDDITHMLQHYTLQISARNGGNKRRVVI